jgi:hypothetical protein
VQTVQTHLFCALLGVRMAGMGCCLFGCLYLQAVLNFGCHSLLLLLLLLPAAAGA